METRECLVDKPRSFLSVGGIYVQVFISFDRQREKNELSLKYR